MAGHIRQPVFCFCFSCPVAVIKTAEGGECLFELMAPGHSLPRQGSQGSRRLKKLLPYPQSRD